MTPESDLYKLIRGMKPELQEGEYVFCTLSPEQIPTSVQLICLFREAEGVTLIITKQESDAHNLPYNFIAAWITLKIHSALDAVGFTAAISTALTRAGISCNVIAAYYHDHLFVPIQDAQRTMAILIAMTQS